jgi:hypothetical protein
MDRTRRLDRRETAAALTEAGFPIAASTLATLATRGGGPRYVVFNRRCLYDISEAMRWAEERAGAPAATASEARMAQAASAESDAA